MNKKLALFLILAMLLSLLIGCSGSTGDKGSEATSTPDATDTATDTATDSGSTEVKELIFAHYNSAESYTGQGVTYYIDYINEHCPTVHITVYHNGELGGITECMEGCAAGTIDMTNIGCGQGSSMFEDLQVFALPYLVTSGDDMYKLMENWEDIDFMKEIFDGFTAATGIEVIGISASPDARQLTCNFPVYSPDDLDGVKIRSINSPVYTRTVESMGAIAVPIDWTEVATALSTGVVSGQENPITTLQSYQMWDYQDYVMLTAHIYDMGMYNINSDTWSSLTADEQAVFKEAAKATAEWSWDLVSNAVEQARADCEANGMTFIGVEDGLDIQAFKAGAEEMIATEYSQYVDVINSINDYLGY